MTPHKFEEGKKCSDPNCMLSLPFGANWVHINQAPNAAATIQSGAETSGNARDYDMMRPAFLSILLACLTIGVCAPGCFLFGGGRPKPSLVSDDPGAKIPAIKKASAAHETQTARQLVKSLDSDDAAVRFYAIRGLQNLTGETFGYVWYVDEPDRRSATEKWKHWLDENGGELAGGGNESK